MDRPRTKSLRCTHTHTLTRDDKPQSVKQRPLQEKGRRDRQDRAVSSVVHCMKTSAVSPVVYPPSQETAVHAYVRPAPHAAPKRIHACEDRQGITDSLGLCIFTCLLPRCRCALLHLHPKRAKAKRTPVHARLGRGYVLCRMEKEWAPVGMRWITGVVGSHGCSRLWARAPRMFLPGERCREYIFVGD